MTPERIAAIADAYDRAQHTPNHPSYSAFVADTLAQYRSMTSLPDKVWVIPTRGYDIAYRSSVDMFHDLATYNRLVVAVDGSPFAENHPLSAFVLTGEIGELQTINTHFRAVHDYYGHFLGRHPFETFAGEIAAYQEHARRYSPAALPALFSETVGQLCYFYARGVFVPVQKAAILPNELMEV